MSRWWVHQLISISISRYCFLQLWPWLASKNPYPCLPNRTCKPAFPLLQFECRVIQDDTFKICVMFFGLFLRGVISLMCQHVLPCCGAPMSSRSASAAERLDLQSCVKFHPRKMSGPKDLQRRITPWQQRSFVLTVSAFTVALYHCMCVQ